MTGIPSFTLKDEILLRDHSSANPTSPKLNFPAGLLQGHKFPIISTHPNKTSGWQPVFQQIPQLQGGIEIVLEDTKGAVSGSCAIVFMEDNRIFFIITGLEDSQTLPLCQKANQVLVGVLNWIL